MAELADALDLGSSVSRREGSSPFTRTKKTARLNESCRFYFLYDITSKCICGTSP